MKPVEIAKNIYWVGAIDWQLRNFHGYLTQRGSTYNAYLVMDESITLVDTVKSHLCDEMLARISEIVDPAKIENIVCNHVEMDHSGSLPTVLQRIPGAKIITSPNGQKGLSEHFRGDWNYHVVKSGDSVSIGAYSLNFTLTPMVHWPDNMMTYVPEASVLLSNDAFGQHCASSEHFDDEYPLDIILYEAKKYYANIVMPYSDQVRKALDAAAGLKIGIIGPSHGLVWRGNIARIVDSYKKWSAGETARKAVIVYDTMWNSTKKIAASIQNAFEAKSYATRLMGLQENHISDIMTEVIDASHLCVGSPTLNNNMLPTVSAFLTYFKGLAPKRKITGLAFGSYGWGGQSIGHINAALMDAGCEMLDDIKIKYIPDEAGLRAVEENVQKAI